MAAQTKCERKRRKSPRAVERHSPRVETHHKEIRKWFMAFWGYYCRSRGWGTADLLQDLYIKLLEHEQRSVYDPARGDYQRYVMWVARSVVSHYAESALIRNQAGELPEEILSDYRDDVDLDKTIAVVRDALGAAAEGNEEGQLALALLVHWLPGRTNLEIVRLAGRDEPYWKLVRARKWLIDHLYLLNDEPSEETKASPVLKGGEGDRSRGEGASPQK